MDQNTGNKPPERIPTPPPPPGEPEELTVFSPAPDSSLNDAVGKKRTMPIVVSLLVLAFLLLAGGAFAYFNIYLSPKQVLGRMVSKMNNLDSAKYNAKVILAFESDGQNPPIEGNSQPQNNPLFGALLVSNFTFDASGVYDMADDMEKVDFDTLVSAKVGNLKIGEFQVIGKGDNFYLKIVELQSFGLPVDFSSLINQWIKIDPKELEEKYGVESPEQTDVQLSEEQQKEFNEFVKDNFPFEFVEKLKDEEMVGVKVYHYKVRLNKENGIKVMKKAFELMGKQKELENYDLDEAFKHTEVSDIDLWVGKGNNYLYKTTFRVTSYPDSTANVGQNAGVRLTMDVGIELSEHNKPASIVEPQDTKSIEEILNQYTNTPAFPYEDDSLPSGTPSPSSGANLQTGELLRILNLEEFNLPSVSGAQDE